jgi:hypothetical protein
MDINLEFNIINKFLENKFEFLNIEQHSHLYNFEISYLEKNLLYVKINNKENKGWNEDIKIKLYTIENNDFEELSIGSSNYETKEIEFYTDIDLIEKKEILKNYIPNTIYINHSFNINNKVEFYDLKYFLYTNKFYSFINNFDIINDFIKENYNHVLDFMEYIINPNLKLLIKILFFLNKNGGIFINENLKNLNIDTINKDTNICYMNDGIISIIFCKINFLYEDLLIEDLKAKNKLVFENYLNNFEIIFDKDIVNTNKLTLENDYYNNIIHHDNYIFYIMSKDTKYNIEKLPNNYFCLTNKNEIKNDVEVNIYNKIIQSSFKLDDKYIKNKFNNNIIFKL